MGVARLVEDYWTCGKRWDLEGFLFDRGHRWPKRPDGRPMSAAECGGLILHWLDERSIPNGRLDGVTPAELERRARWSGKPGLLWEALVETGWIDDVGGGAFAWHDYYSLNGETIKERNKKRAQRDGLNLSHENPGTGRVDKRGGQGRGTSRGDKREGQDPPAECSGLSGREGSCGGGGLPSTPPPPPTAPQTPTTTRSSPPDGQAADLPEPARRLADALHAAARGLRRSCEEAAVEWLAVHPDLADALAIVAKTPPGPFADVYAYRREMARPKSRESIADEKAQIEAQKSSARQAARELDNAKAEALAAEFEASGYTSRLAWAADRKAGELRTGDAAARRGFEMGRGAFDAPSDADTTTAACERERRAPATCRRVISTPSPPATMPLAPT